MPSSSSTPPTSARRSVGAAATRPDRLRGTLGIIDISKPRGDIFCDEVERLLHERLPELAIVRLRKPTFAKPAPADLRGEIGARCQAVIQALAD